MVGRIDDATGILRVNDLGWETNHDLNNSKAQVEKLYASIGKVDGFAPYAKLSLLPKSTLLFYKRRKKLFDFAESKIIINLREKKISPNTVCF